MLQPNSLLFLGSVLLQLASVVFALRVLRHSTVRLPWLILAIGLSCMAGYRIVGMLFAAHLTPLTQTQFEALSAVASLIISALFFLALPAIRHITEEEQREATARRAVEQQLASLINNMPASVFIKDLAGRYVMVNQRFIQHSDLKLDGIIGRTDTELFPELAQAFGADDEEVARTRTPQTTEHEITQQGQRVSLLVTKFPIYDSDKRVHAVCGVATDITNVKRAQAALTESQRFVARVLATTPDLVYVYDILDDRITFKNRSFRSFLGHPADSDAPGLDEAFVRESMHPEDRHLLERVRERFAGMQDGVAREVEMRLRHADGAYRWIAARETVFTRDADGAVRQILGTAEDITPRRNAEAERDRLLAETRRARADAEQANRAKDRFLAVLSHELRTPLNPVLMSVSQLAGDPDLPQRVRDDLAMMRRNIDLEVRLIDDLLDIERIKSGKLRVEPKPTSVHALLRHVWQSCLDSARERELSLDLAPGASADTVVADPARLQQVIWNVVKNAIKFTPAGGAIRLTTRQVDVGGAAWIELSVDDTGVGIAPELMPRLFNAFEQGPLTEPTHFGGLGLGLAIAKAIVETHHGTIEASSEGPGRGSRFVVRLPLIDAPAPSEPEPPTPADPKRRSATVLLVEDHPDTNKVLCRLLKFHGYEVTPAFGLAEALGQLRQRPFDLLVSDIGLPDGDGYELLRQARAIRPTRAVCMSGYGMDEDMRRSREAGFVDHVVKPVDAAQLAEAVGRALSDRDANASPPPPR